MAPTSNAALLLHGQPGNAQDWDAVRAAIDGRVPTLAIDRPGWDGRSTPTDLAGNARAAVSVLDDAGIERATLVGHSLGGAVAAWLAAEYPERVGALVLAAPSASCQSLNRLDDLLATPFLGSALATGAFIGLGLTLKLRAARHRISSGFGLPEDYLLSYSRTLLNPLVWHSFAVEQRTLTRELPELELRLESISAATMIVTGTADRIVSPASARALAARIPGADLVQLRRASHLLLQERPVELAELIVAAASGAATAAVAAPQDSLGSG
ncbi:MAG TPA: alpha/beta hydrolase [Solirubrobacteraceae bacterium]|nr:alpha/beta hydrolase [Solirubrobacteraceae bacterium]